VDEVYRVPNRQEGGRKLIFEKERIEVFVGAIPLARLENIRLKLVVTAGN
jgi:hypothetical protein